MDIHTIPLQKTNNYITSTLCNFITSSLTLVSHDIAKIKIDREPPVIFKGVRVGIDRDEKCRNILEELLDTHKKANAPEYTVDHFSS